MILPRRCCRPDDGKPAEAKQRPIHDKLTGADWYAIFKELHSR
jgi:hypothetical protein